MSKKYPIIAVTGSAGSGITTVRKVFEKIFEQNNISPAFVHGNSYRKYPRAELEKIFRQAEKERKTISAFGPELNLLNRLEGLFREFSRSGTGCIREYIETDEQEQQYGIKKGSFSPWEELSENTDLLFYEGQHGGCVEASWTQRTMSASHNPFVIEQRLKSQTEEDDGVDIAKWVDLLIGIVPNINLEWMQKINRSCRVSNCSPEEAVNIILRRMPDYVHYIAPQFSLTDINFQRIPFVDTSNPFVHTDDLPTEAECLVVVRFRDPKKYDLIAYKKEFNGAYFSRPNTLVIPSGYMANAIRVICTPIIKSMVERRKS